MHSSAFFSIFLVKPQHLVQINSISMWHTIKRSLCSLEIWGTQDFYIRFINKINHIHKSYSIKKMIPITGQIPVQIISIKFITFWWWVRADLWPQQRGLWIFLRNFLRGAPSVLLYITNVSSFELSCCNLPRPDMKSPFLPVMIISQAL